MYFTSSIAPIYPAYVRVVDANGNVVIKQDDRGHNAYDFGIPSNDYGLNRPFMSTAKSVSSQSV